MQNDEPNKETPLIKAVKNNDKEEVERLLKQGADVNAKGNKGNTALIWAVRFDAVNFVKQSEKNDPVDGVVSRLKEYGLEDALVNGSSGNIFELLQTRFMQYSDPHGYVEKTGRDKEIIDALVEAVENNLGIVKSLIENGADVNAQNDNGDTPLVLAVKENKLDVVALLTGKGTCVINTKDKDETPAIILALKKGYSGIVEILVHVGNVDDVNAQDKNGNTALMVAAIIGNSLMANFLLKNGADVNAKNNDGKTALDLALENDHPKIAEFLREHGAKRGCDL